MHLTPQILEAAYDFLRATPPFNRWKLPEGETVSFIVGGAADLRGYYRLVNSQHTIMISAKCASHVDTIIMSVAHEAIHLYLESKGLEREDVLHSAEFTKKAKLVCKHHGWDYGAFV